MIKPVDFAPASSRARATKPAMDSLPGKSGKADTAFHTRNFLDCVKSRKATNCPVEVGHRSTTATLLARIALMRKQHLRWDAQQERVVNDKEANALLSYEYREPWKLEV